MKTLTKRVNIAPSSNEGHFVEDAINVIELEQEITESFIVKGKSKLVTKNHETLELNKDCLINTQVVYNPFSKMYEKVVD